MFAALPLSLPPTTTPSYALVGQTVASEATLGSLPSKMVYAPIAAPALNNQRGNQSAIAGGTAQTAPQSSAQTTLFNLSTLSRPSGSPDFSSAFFTQLLAQSTSEAQSSLASNFTRNRISDPEVLANFSFVKYLPSDAGKPAPKPARVEFAAPAQAAPEPQVRVQQQATAPQAAPVQAERSFAAVVMRHSFSYAPVVTQQNTRSAAVEAPRSDRPLPKDAAAAYARTARRNDEPKAVEAVAESQT